MPLMVASCVVLTCIVALLLIFPPSAGGLPRCKSPNGIAERASVETDDGELAIMLLSDNVENPVLLICGGGPGIPQYLLESSYPSPLPEEFTVCYWDYRGTGASYRSGVAAEAMTTERYVKDAAAVTDYLSRRFSNDRIFIMGHSFGTYIALKTVQAYPEKYQCYLAMSQIVDQPESEYLAFDYMAEQYEKSGNAKMAARFRQYDIRASREDYDEYFFSGLRDKAMHDLGVGTARNMHSVISGIFLPSLRCTAYTQAERINIWKSKALSKAFPVTRDAIGNFNAFAEIPKVEIPIFFLVGKYDYTCCASLQQKYYETVEAPQKELYVFENSAHSPIYEEFDEGKRVLCEIKSKLR